MFAYEEEVEEGGRREEGSQVDERFRGEGEEGTGLVEEGGEEVSY